MILTRCRSTLKESIYRQGKGTLLATVQRELDIYEFVMYDLKEHWNKLEHRYKEGFINAMRNVTLCLLLSYFIIYLLTDLGLFAE